MNLILFDQNRKNLLPFTYTRPIAEFRCGILTLSEKWSKRVSEASVSYLTERYLSEKYPTIKQYLIDIYQYYSELVILNALEAINLFTNEFSDKMKYYCINGGMEQLAELIYNKLKKVKNVSIYKGPTKLPTIVRV